jgi:hypothetical protein
VGANLVDVGIRYVFFVPELAHTLIVDMSEDAEDEADNWWVEWGALGERAQEVPRALSFDFGAAIADINTQAAVESAA